MFSFLIASVAIITGVPRLVYLVLVASALAHFVAKEDKPGPGPGITRINVRETSGTRGNTPFHSAQRSAEFPCSPERLHEIV